MKYTEEQLKDPKWWNENAPEGAQVLINRADVGSFWKKWDGGKEHIWNKYDETWYVAYLNWSREKYNQVGCVIHERPVVDVRSYKCFKQVADVIGEERAVEELGKVDRVTKGVLLGAAFLWDRSPQGAQFWSDIDDGIDPYPKFILQPKKDMKFDGGKPQMNLLPADALLAVAEVLTFGAQKYEADSWKQVEGGKERYEAALLRHWAAFKSGEENDAETGLSHWAHIACNALFLVHLHSGDSNE